MSLSTIRNPSLTRIQDVAKNHNPTRIQDVIRNPYTTRIEDPLTYNGSPITWWCELGLSNKQNPQQSIYTHTLDRPRTSWVETRTLN